MNRWDMVGEVLGGVCIFLLPIIFLFVGHALGL